MITDALNIRDIISEFHQRKLPSNTTVKVQHQQLGKGLEEAVEERLGKAAQNGDWMILENLHLVDEWLPILEDKMANWKSQTELNDKFRLWATCTPVQSFPTTLLEKSIKVALQPAG